MPFICGTGSEFVSKGPIKHVFQKHLLSSLVHNYMEIRSYHKQYLNDKALNPRPYHPLILCVVALAAQALILRVASGTMGSARPRIQMGEDAHLGLEGQILVRCK